MDSFVDLTCESCQQYMLPEAASSQLPAGVEMVALNVPPIGSV